MERLSSTISSIRWTDSSSVNWCEADYAVHSSVAEFWNTASSLAMVVAGWLLLARHREALALEARFVVTAVGVVVVGVGSMAFHATLSYWGQLLDELPMLWSVLANVYIILRAEKAGGSTALAAALVAHGVVTSAGTALTSGTTQFFIFQTSFGSLECYCLYQTYRLRAHVDRSLVDRGLLAYAAAIVAWLVDLNACHHVSVLPVNPQLHAVWHCLVSVGLYNCVLAHMYRRQQVLGIKVRVQGGVLPWLKAIN